MLINFLKLIKKLKSRKVKLMKIVKNVIYCKLYLNNKKWKWGKFLLS